MVIVTLFHGDIVGVDAHIDPLRRLWTRHAPSYRVNFTV